MEYTVYTYVYITPGNLNKVDLNQEDRRSREIYVNHPPELHQVGISWHFSD